VSLHRRTKTGDLAARGLLCFRKPSYGQSSWSRGTNVELWSGRRLVIRLVHKPAGRETEADRAQEKPEVRDVREASRTAS
jgi:hypothetical protein